MNATRRNSTSLLAPFASFACAAAVALALAVATTSPRAQQAEPPQKTSEPRSFAHEAEIDATPAELYRLFTTTDGVRTVFPGADARIGDAVGGDYCVMFAPHVDPNGDRLGTNGAKIRELVPGAKVVFEWRGRPHDPAMNVLPLPTAVTVTFAPLDGGRTKLRLEHGGFGHGKDWDGSIQYFDGAWRGVVEGLVSRFAREPGPPKELRGRTQSTLYLVRLEPGPKWVANAPLHEQPKLMNHAHYMTRLMEWGFLLLGGPCGADGVGLLQVPDRATAERLFAADPAVQHGTFRFAIEEWRTSVPEALAARKKS